MSKSRNNAVLGILLLVFIFFITLMVFASYTMKGISSKSNGSAIEVINGKSGQIGVVEVDGVIMDSKTAIEKLLVAEKDKSINAIIMRINSPGGAVGPTQEIYEEIRRIDRKKPVYASFGSIAASGGYYIGAATRRIYSNAGTLTGSIGVIMQFMDLSKLYEFAKVSQINIKAGKYKDAGQPNRALTGEEKKLMKTMMKGVHKQFINDIMKVRSKKIKGKISDIAQGQIFSGAKAKELGLVDEIGSLWTAGRKIHKELKLSGEFGLKYIKKKKDLSVLEFFEKLDNVITKFDMKSYFGKKPMFLYNN